MEQQVQQALARFEAVVRDQLARVERMKQDKDFIDLIAQ